MFRGKKKKERKNKQQKSNLNHLPPDGAAGGVRRRDAPRVPQPAEHVKHPCGGRLPKVKTLHSPIQAVPEQSRR